MQKIFTLQNKKFQMDTLRWLIWALTAFTSFTMIFLLIHSFKYSEGFFLAGVSIISFIALLFINSLLNGLRGIQAELELRNASSDDAQKLQTIIKNIPFDMWLCDREQRYILQSVESYKIRGDMIGRKIEELGQSAEMVLQGKVAESGGTIYKEGTWQVNGEMRDFITMVAPAKSGDGLLGYVGLNLDITERRKSEKQMQHSADQLAMLNDIGRAITTLGDVDSVLNIIREQVQRILPVDAFMVLIYQPETNIVTFPLVYDNGRNWTEPDRKISVDMKSDEVLKTGKSLLVNLTEEEFLESTRNANKSLMGDYSTKYRSFIYAPLITQEKVIGVVSAISYSFNTYTTEHLELLEGVAIQATIAIENARLFQAQQKELSERKQAEQEILKLNMELEERVASRTIQLQEANENLNYEKAHLELYNRRREIIADMTDLLQASLTVNEASQIVSAHLKILFPESDGALYLLNPSYLMELAAVWGESKSLNTIFSTNECWALRRGKPYRYGTGLPAPSCAHTGNHRPSHAICVPLSAQNEGIGNLHISWRKDRELKVVEEEQNFIEDIGNSLALALGNLRLREKLHILSIREALTGLFNRRYLDESLPREMNRAKRNKEPLSVLMFDIDHFKKFNDTYGHEAGDLVLRKISEVILSSIRESDIACRYGGEEFVIILPGTPIDAAEERAEALRNEVSLLKLDHNGKNIGAVTISIGVAAFPQHGATYDTLIKTADEAAYRAKEYGRNQVVVCG
jgi:diguanylate cyclase (GGDEF)-like protein